MGTAINLLALIIPVLGLIVLPGLLLYLGWRLVRAREREARASSEIATLRERVAALEDARAARTPAGGHPLPDRY